jgi:hypothetical protein
MTKVAEALAPQDEKEHLIFRLWWWWRVVWSVVRNLLYIFAILLSFDKATTHFEAIVLCFLVLILQSVNWSQTTHLRLTVEESFSTKRLLFMLLKHSGEETEDAEALINDAENKYLKQNPIYYINLSAASVIYLIVLWKAFTTLLS